MAVVALWIERLPLEMWYLHIFDILTAFSHQNLVEQQLTFWAKVIVQGRGDRRNFRIRWIENSTTTHPMLMNVFGLLRVFIRLMESLRLEQRPTSISAILTLALVKESIEFTMGVNKFQKLYVIKIIHPCMCKGDLPLFLLHFWILVQNMQKQWKNLYNCTFLWIANVLWRFEVIRA